MDSITLNKIRSLRRPLEHAELPENLQILESRTEDLRSVRGFIEPNGTALMYAASFNSYEAVEYLIRMCPNLLGVRGSLTGMTALMYAASYGYTDIVGLLASHEGGIIIEEIPEQPVSATMGSGSTALMLACYFGNDECVESLVPYELGIIDFAGRTAISIAQERNQVMCVRKINELTEEVNCPTCGMVMLSFEVAAHNTECHNPQSTLTYAEIEPESTQKREEDQIKVLSSELSKVVSSICGKARKIRVKVHGDEVVTTIEKKNHDVATEDGARRKHRIVIRTKIPEAGAGANAMDKQELVAKKIENGTYTVRSEYCSENEEEHEDESYEQLAYYCNNNYPGQEYYYYSGSQSESELESGALNARVEKTSHLAQPEVAAAVMTSRKRGVSITSHINTDQVLKEIQKRRHKRIVRKQKAEETPSGITIGGAALPVSHEDQAQAAAEKPKSRRESICMAAGAQEAAEAVKEGAPADITAEDMFMKRVLEAVQSGAFGQTTIARPKELLRCQNRGSPFTCLSHEELEVHKAAACRYEVVKCENSESGCAFVGERRMIAQHQEGCFYRPTFCQNPKCGAVLHNDDERKSHKCPKTK